ncbi:MAG: methionyl-tRNA formyltransferase [Candidatus Lightella neohaematopini]|nr:methionyl-tRNA formyltransferase [Candidatus Lightella neohaematopini]
MQKNLRIVFIGSSIFSLYHLIKLIKKKYCIILIITKPKSKLSKISKKHALNLIIKASIKYNIPILQSQSLNEIYSVLSKLTISLIIIASYGKKLSESIINIPKFGCLNVHGSLLPRWRGSAPIQRAIHYGDCVTGITIIKINNNLDTGNIIYQKFCVIKKYDNSITLCKKLAKMGALILIKLLKINLFDITSTSQNNIGITYAKKLTKQEAKINWFLSSIKLVNMIRAFNPWPMAFFYYQNSIIKIINAVSSNYCINKTPGTIVHYNKWGIYIVTGNGIIILTSIKIITKNSSVIVNTDNNNILMVANRLFKINTILV